MLTWILSVILSSLIVFLAETYDNTTTISHPDLLMLFIIWTAISYLFIDVSKSLMIELYKFIKRKI